jgi:hypothetical protein
MFQILAQLHYMPDGWKDHPQSLVTRSEFVKVFQYKFVNICLKASLSNLGNLKFLLNL